MAIFDSPRGRRLRSARRAAGRGGRNFPAEPLAPFAHPAVGRAVRAGASVDRVRRLPRVQVGGVELGTMGAGIAELGRVCRAGALLATNTSALSVAEIAEATQRPQRVVCMHVFNPAPVLTLVEIVRAPKSSDEAVTTAYEWAERAGKQPVHCNDTPGFIVNRILIPLLNDCVRVLDEAN